MNFNLGSSGDGSQKTTPNPFSQSEISESVSQVPAWKKTQNKPRIQFVEGDLSPNPQKIPRRESIRNSLSKSKSKDSSKKRPVLDPLFKRKAQKRVDSHIRSKTYLLADTLTFKMKEQIAAVQRGNQEAELVARGSGSLVDIKENDDEITINDKINAIKIDIMEKVLKNDNTLSRELFKDTETRMGSMLYLDDPSVTGNNPNSNSPPTMTRKPSLLLTTRRPSIKLAPKKSVRLQDNFLVPSNAENPDTRKRCSKVSNNHNFGKMASLMMEAKETDSKEFKEGASPRLLPSPCPVQKKSQGCIASTKCFDLEAKKLATLNKVYSQKIISATSPIHSFEPRKKEISVFEPIKSNLS